MSPVYRSLLVLVSVGVLATCAPLWAQVEEETSALTAEERSPVSTADEEVEPISSADCGDCHEESDHQTVIAEDLEHSVHEFLECLDCHVDKGTMPHLETGYPANQVGCQGCRDCHTDAADQYQAHGRSAIGDCEDIPTCAS